MYLSYYQLKKQPFQIAADPEFLWLGEKHREGLASLKYGVLDNKGFLLLTGDVGTGKTTLINALVKSLGDEVVVARIPDPGMSKLDFMNFIARSFRIEQEFDRKEPFLYHLEQFLNAASGQNKTVLLVIDEAQRIEPDLLEEIRLLSNIERPEKKLLNIFLVGQNEFNDILSRPGSRALRQRITINYALEALDEEETGELIRHRLWVAGAGYDIFSAEAIEEIHALSHGLPREIIIICDHCLLTGYVRDEQIISKEIVVASAEAFRLPVFSADTSTAATNQSQAETGGEVLEDAAETQPDPLEIYPEIPSFRPWKMAVSLVASVVVIGAAAFVLQRHINKPLFQEVGDYSARVFQALPFSEKKVVEQASAFSGKAQSPGWGSPSENSAPAKMESMQSESDRGPQNVRPVAYASSSPAEKNPLRKWCRTRLLLHLKTFLPGRRR